MGTILEEPLDILRQTLIWTRKHLSHTLWRICCKSAGQGPEYGGMANFGIRPTISDNHVTIEVHIFDFDSDIYGERIYVEVVRRLRDEEKFDSLEALVTKMDQDRNEARKILSGVINPDPDA